MLFLFLLDYKDTILGILVIYRIVYMFGCSLRDERHEASENVQSFVHICCNFNLTDIIQSRNAYVDLLSASYQVLRLLIILNCIR